LSLPGDPGTVRGLTASLVVLDETQSLPDGGQELFASVRPMLATTRGRMIVLGTPLDRVGLLFDMWEGGIALDWQKLHVPSNECPRISTAFLESERRLLGDAIFRREYLAEFSASQTGMFDHALLQGALLPHHFSFRSTVARACPDLPNVAGPQCRDSRSGNPMTTSNDHIDLGAIIKPANAQAVIAALDPA
jgi:hypothetical protein